MPHIFDTIQQLLFPALRRTLAVVDQVDIQQVACGLCHRAAQICDGKVVEKLFLCHTLSV